MVRALLGVMAVAILATATVLTGQRPAIESSVRPEPTLVLAELFTSEGCSSCPPADGLLEMLSNKQPVAGVYVVALSEHVTYWDHQGWKDPFGSEQFTSRQKSYGFGFNLDSIYTPQIVIDGVTEMVGSDDRRVRRMLADAARKPKPRLTVEASTTSAGAVSAKVSGPGLTAGAGEGVDLWWAITEDNLVIDVKRGENASRTLRHSGVVRVLVAGRTDQLKAESFTGTEFVLRPEWKRENLRVVAFVQAKKSRRVISVGWSNLM